MMTTQRRYLIAAIAGGGLALIVSGCDRPDSRADAVGQKLDRPIGSATPGGERAPGTAASGVPTPGKATGTIHDLALAAKVHAALIAEPSLKASRFDVETRDGVVTLAGNVASAELGHRAVEVASATAGVRDVVDKLVVKAS
jgi:hyperosmotically inducible protein